ncbi:MAG: hypothetical protein ACR2K5_16615 [Pseudolabrys sp.]
MSAQATACAALGLLSAAVLAACAGPGPGLTGNDTGGIIPYASVSPEQARTMASEHCASYNKQAKATGVDPHYGGYYSFSCVFDARRPY